MTDALPSGWMQPNKGSWLSRWLTGRARHDAEFDCAVRVVEGLVGGERARWSHRRSALDPLVVDGVQEFTHGDVRLVLRMSTVEQVAGGSGVRPGYLVWRVRTAGSPALLELAGDADVAARFGVG